MYHFISLVKNHHFSPIHWNQFVIFLQTLNDVSSPQSYFIVVSNDQKTILKSKITSQDHFQTLRRRTRLNSSVNVTIEDGDNDLIIETSSPVVQ